MIQQSMPRFCFDLIYNFIFCNIENQHAFDTVIDIIQQN